MCIISVFRANYSKSKDIFSYFIFSDSIKYLNKVIQFYIFTNCAHVSLTGSRVVLFILESTLHIIGNAESNWCPTRSLIIITNQLIEGQ